MKIPVATLIDLLFVSSPTQVNSCHTVPPLTNSDHFGLQLYISVTYPRRQIKIPLRCVWRYSHADFNSTANLLDDTNWDVLLKKWYQLQLDNCFLHIIWASVFHKSLSNQKEEYLGSPMPWRKQCVKCKTLFRKAKSTGDPKTLKLTTYVTYTTWLIYPKVLQLKNCSASFLFIIICHTPMSSMW